MRTPPKRATITDVARDAGVSLKTVSRVMNGVPTVDARMREDVLAAAKRLGYRPHRGAATMRSGRSSMVGMIIRDMTNPFYSTVAAGAADEAEEHHCLLITCSSEGSPQRQAELAEAVFAQRPGGLLITPTRGTDATIAAEVAMGTPVVAVDERLDGLTVDTVSFDNHRAARGAVAAAIRMGRRRFAALSDSDALATMPLRVAGATEALTEGGLAFGQGHVLTGIHTEPEARAAAAQLLSVAEPPDAIFCANNVSAIGAAAEIHQRGLDVAIVVFDEFPLSRTLPFPVVAIDHDDREMGRAAARLLFRRVAEPSRPVENVVIPTTLRTH
ncbi:LacI family transcriptional regulator [Tessaracoccus rhinocerotis]|uniref:LacI family transcriptional regulator n=1 Tax=Tessaracoccus rhinocerotis TaxID=1689449 RepID=A0A553K2T0_9ACTN|nr:LacI family DNA-binding transcriptional regulator [Tessaracoccus rhinocerotis]TRY18995.1 LacI family transcriptional regulator [Tessaracoccus rhinocerotis]